jgi:hypothetical protein
MRVIERKTSIFCNVVVVYIVAQKPNPLCYSDLLLQLPRYLTFDRTRQIRPFYTEFCVYQKADGPKGTVNDTTATEEPQLPEVLCSKISRLYDTEGRLQQGCTSFFTLQRFGADSEDG